MPQSFKLLVLSGAIEGREEEFNRWYDDIHLGDVPRIESFVAAQRFRLHTALTLPAYPYCTIYDVETDDPDAAMKRLADASGTPAMELSDAMLPDFYGVLYQEQGPARVA